MTKLRRATCDSTFTFLRIRVIFISEFLCKCNRNSSHKVRQRTSPFTCHCWSKRPFKCPLKDTTINLHRYDFHGIVSRSEKLVSTFLSINFKGTMCARPLSPPKCSLRFHSITHSADNSTQCNPWFTCHWQETSALGERVVNCVRFNSSVRYTSGRSVPLWRRKCPLLTAVTERTRDTWVVTKAAELRVISGKCITGSYSHLEAETGEGAAESDTDRHNGIHSKVVVTGWSLRWALTFRDIRQRERMRKFSMTLACALTFVEEEMFTF